MNRAPITAEVIRHWREKAGDRQTVVFCSTVAHAENAAEAFNDRGIPEVPPENWTMTQARICCLLIFTTKEIEDVETKA
ncbi:MAG: hypothetical protein HLUCCA12_09505, partial [Rhodobacteraceae bacterium HLUCCA12]